MANKVFEVEIGGRSFEVEAPDQESALKAIRSHVGKTDPGQSGAPAAPAPQYRVGDTFTDPETGETKRIVDPFSMRQPGEVTMADVESRQRILANRQPTKPGPSIPLEGTEIGPSDRAGMARAANDPAFVNKVLASTPEGSRDIAMQMLGGQRAFERGPVETFARTGINALGANLPRLMSSALTPGVPLAMEHEIEKAADAAGARNNPRAATAGMAAGLAGQAFALPAAATNGVLRGAATGALLSGAPVAADTRGDLAETAGAALTGAAVGGIGGGLMGQPGKAQMRAEALRNAPTREALREAEGRAYDAARNLDVQYSQPAFARMAKEAGDTLRAEGLDKTLHPKAMAALGRIEEAAQGAPTLENVETLRRIVRDAARSPDEGRLAGILRQRLDDFVENAGAQDVVRGDPTEASALLREARGNSAAGKRSDAIVQALTRAEENAGSAYSGGNIDNAIRQQFKSLMRDEKAMRGFSAEERDAIRDVVMGTPTRNALRIIGKLMPSSGLGGAVVGGGAVTALGPLGAAVPGVGAIAKALADRGTRKAAERTEALVRSRSPLAAGAAPQEPFAQLAPPDHRGLLLARLLAGTAHRPIAARR